MISSHFKNSRPCFLFVSIREKLPSWSICCWRFGSTTCTMISAWNIFIKDTLKVTDIFRTETLARRNNYQIMCNRLEVNQWRWQELWYRYGNRLLMILTTAILNEIYQTKTCLLYTIFINLSFLSIITFIFCFFFAVFTFFPFRQGMDNFISTVFFFGLPPPNISAFVFGGLLLFLRSTLCQCSWLQPFLETLMCFKYIRYRFTTLDVLMCASLLVDSFHPSEPDWFGFLVMEVGEGSFNQSHWTHSRYVTICNRSPLTDGVRDLFHACV